MLDELLVRDQVEFTLKHVQRKVVPLDLLEGQLALLYLQDLGLVDDLGLILSRQSVEWNEVARQRLNSSLSLSTAVTFPEFAMRFLGTPFPLAPVPLSEQAQGALAVADKPDKIAPAYLLELSGFQRSDPR